MDETWKQIPGYEGLYEVSDAGRVRSIARNGTLGGILSPDNSRGYWRIHLFRQNRSVRFMVHRLVMLAFFGPSDLEVNHKNGKRGDNRIENLEYVTRSENHKHAYDVLGQERMKGSRHGCSKLNETQATEILGMCRSGIPQADIAQRFGVSVPTVSMIYRRRTWRHI